MPIRTTLLPLALLLSACIEYEINKPGADAPGEPPVTDTGDPPDTGTDTALPPEECVLDFVPGDAAIDESCAGGVGGFDPVVEWTYGGMGALCLGPVVAPLDGDAIPDIVAVSCHLDVVAMAGDGSGVLWTHDLVTAVPAVGDLDGDGVVEVVVADSFSVAALDAETGALLWQGPAVLDPYDHMSGGLALADLDGDGVSEILAGSSVLSGLDGSLLGRGTVGRASPHPWEAGWRGASFPVAADLDGDGVQEVVTGGGAFGRDGATKWATGASDGYPAIADFDLDGDPEIVVAAVDGLRLHAHDGALLWSLSLSNGHVGMPTVADFDGDGAPEIVFASDTTLRMVDGDGTLVWELPISEWSGRTGAVAFDFDGDGAIEVVHADERRLAILDGATGAVRYADDGHESGTDSEAPVVADVDGDGSAEVVYLQSGAVEGVTVLGDGADSWMPGRQVWNQQADWIENVTDGLAIPARPAPSWTTHNTFRAGLLSEAPPSGPAADLFVETPEACVLSCDEQVELAFVVGNEGPVAAGATVRVSAGGVVLVEETLGELASGERRQLVYELDPAVAGGALDVRVTSAVGQCDRADDDARIALAACE